MLENYFELSFLRNESKDKIQNFLTKEFVKNSVFKDVLGSVYYNFLDWDTKYFGINTIKIQYVDANRYSDLQILLNTFEAYCIDNFKAEYFFLEVPSEDIILIQKLNLNNFKLIETRLHYFTDKLKSFESLVRHKVRLADKGDIENLKVVAAKMRNEYDRFHADKDVFNTETADKFLSTYIENAIQGFSDIVLVPDSIEAPSNSFLTADFQKKYFDEFGLNVAKMVLSAVDSTTNKGWYRNLISEMSFLLKNENIDIVHFNTQSTNKAVIKVWTSLGYQYGRCTHILSKKL